MIKFTCLERICASLSASDFPLFEILPATRGSRRRPCPQIGSGTHCAESCSRRVRPSLVALFFIHLFLRYRQTDLLVTQSNPLIHGHFPGLYDFEGSYAELIVRMPEKCKFGLCNLLRSIVKSAYLTFWRVEDEYIDIFKAALTVYYTKKGFLFFFFHPFE